MKIGLTGSIATGKSTVLKILRELGAITIDADELAREVTKPGSLALKEIAENLGEEFITEAGELDRALLGKKIFSDQTAKKKLESIVHPKIDERMKKLFKEYNRRYPEKMIVVDMPLLYEVNKEQEFDEVWVVWVDTKTQIKRLVKRNGFSRSEAQNRIASQIPLENKIKRAGRVIDNSGDLSETEKQVREIFFEITCRS